MVPVKVYPQAFEVTSQTRVAALSRRVFLQPQVPVYFR